MFCQGFSEPDAGSDLASLRTTARDAGDRFVVSGRKLWTSSADIADWIYLAVRTGPAPRHRGLSVLVAPIDAPGITVSAHATLGGGAIGEVVLEDVEIPRAQLVGPLDGGWSVLMGTLDHERVTSEKVGVVLWLLDRLDELAETAAERTRLLRLRGEAEAARLHGRRAARAARRGTAGERAELDGEARDRGADAAGRGRRGRAARAGRAPRGGDDDARRPDRGVPPRGGGDDDLRRRRRGAAPGHRAARARVSGMTLPLEGLRVLEYAQYVAGPFAGMLLADLGADVIKVESPAGDAWRHYEPFEAGESRAFYALNRNKRSVVLDLKTDAGRRASRALLAGADAVLHNFPPDRAARYGLDRETVRAINPSAAWCMVSALGSDGPEAELTAFDLVAQALSGLLLADARPGDEIPRRAGGIAMADFTAGLLAAVSILAGLVGRRDDGGPAPGVEVSLLGAALAVQAQRFVSVEALDGAARRQRTRPPATERDLAAHGARVRAAEELEPYYRAYRAADGFFVLTCLNEAQRRTTLRLLGLEDPFVGNPQAKPASDPERAARMRLVRRFEAILERETASHWIRRLRAAGVPAAQVRTLDQLYDDPQALANGLVQDVPAPGGDTVRLLGGVFKIEGAAAGARRGVPRLGEHTAEVLADLGVAP